MLKNITSSYIKLLQKLKPFFLCFVIGFCFLFYVFLEILQRLKTQKNFSISTKQQEAKCSSSIREELLRRHHASKNMKTFLLVIYLNNQTRFFLCLLQHVFFWNTDAAIEENILNRDQQRLIGKPLNYKTLNSTKKNIWGKNKQLLWTQNLNWSNFTNNWIKLDYQQHEELFY